MSRGGRGSGAARRRPGTKRLVLAGVAIICGAFATIDSLANVTARAAPAVAHKIAPWNGVVTNRAAERAFAVAPTKDGQSPAARLARSALRQDATSSEALVVLGLQAQLRSDLAATQAIFDQSTKLSRRELQARLWGIEDGAARGDLDQVLANYDIALRTSTQAQEILFPILTSALGNALVRERVAELIRSSSIWREPFLRYASRTRSNPQEVAVFLGELGQAGFPVKIEDRLSMVDALLETRASELAWQFYSAVNPQARRDRSRDPYFERGGKASSLFDWQLGEGASFQQGRTGAIVDFSMPSATSGTLLRQAQLLPPGRYELAGISASVDQPEYARPFWLITCTDGREIAQVALENSPSGERAFRGLFTVPANCSGQMVSLIARSSDSIAGVTGQISRAQVTPVRSSGGLR